MEVVPLDLGHAYHLEVQGRVPGGPSGEHASHGRGSVLRVLCDVADGVFT